MRRFIVVNGGQRTADGAQMVNGGQRTGDGGRSVRELTLIRLRGPIFGFHCPPSAVRRPPFFARPLSAVRRSPSEDPSPNLIQFDGFEKRLEVAFAEALVA